MILMTDYKNRKIRFSPERIKHLKDNHPEMRGQSNKIQETLFLPDCIIKSPYEKLLFINPAIYGGVKTCANNSGFSHNFGY